jgi:hypothetical protein
VNPWGIILKLLKVSALAALCAFAATSLSAASINFDDSSKIGGVYYEDGYQFEEVGSGGVTVAGGGCVSAGSLNTGCLLLQNHNSGKITKMSREDGEVFDLLSFTFDGRDGSGPALYVSTSTTGGTLFSEPNGANTMTSSGLLSQFTNVTMIFFYDAGNGSARVDDIVTAEVPLPASAFLLLGGLGGLVAMRRRKS